MFDVLRDAIQQVRRLLAELEPDRFDGEGARSLVEAFGELERLSAAGKSLAARQVVATGSWKQGGAHRDAADWLAATTGATVGAARATLETSSRLASLPSTEAALRAGALSGAQVDAIADAASVDPGAELELLERSAHDGVRGLRNECARVKAAAFVDEEARYERIRVARSLRGWTDADGAGRIDIRGPLDATAKVLAALAPYERELFEQARSEGRRERHDAFSFDALIALAEAPRDDDVEGSAKPAGMSGVVRIDHAALVRGMTEPGEVCEIVGQGPIPVTVASRLLDDAFLKAVVVDGTDVVAVAHLGRTIPARLRTAVEEMHPECDIEGCHVATNLEIDHNQPIEEFGKAELCNLGRLCLHHHHHKHRHRLRLVGPPGRMQFVPSPIPPSPIPPSPIPVAIC
jgi:Domain of unknown function (DUF222)